MKLKVLGCSGGLGGAQGRTTAFLADDDILIDGGTGVGDLELDELVRIDHVFITHAHLDHIAAIPLLIDSVGELRNAPITVHASPETLRILEDGRLLVASDNNYPAGNGRVRGTPEDTEMIILSAMS